MENYQKEYSFTAYFSGTGNEITNGVLVKNRKELEILILCFGNNVEIQMTEDEQLNYSDCVEFLDKSCHSNIRWTYKEIDDVLNLISRIPIPKKVQERLYVQEEKINPDFVHKKQADNVLLSKVEKVGNMFCFKGFHQSPELVIDHESDHLQGLCIFEVVRQAGIAAVHLLGTPILALWYNIHR